MEIDKATYNSHFLSFKNLHKDKDALVLCTGASLSKYKFNAKEGDLVIGVNRLYNYPYFMEKLDYYFFGSEYEKDEAHRNNINSIDKKIQKFASAYRDGVPTGHGNITPQNAALINAIPFECGLVNFTHDIAEYKMLGHSIVFPTLQFLLYTGVKQISIVGCDVVGFYNDEDHIREWWNKFNTWIKATYPNVEIISINPVGLKGMFMDLFQNEKTL